MDDDHLNSTTDFEEGGESAMEFVIKIEVKEVADLVKELQHQPDVNHIVNVIRCRLQEALEQES